MKPRHFVRPSPATTVQRLLLALLLSALASTAVGQAYKATRLKIPDLVVNIPGMSVNASGQVAGSYGFIKNGSQMCCHAFIWSASGGMIDLGTLGGSISAANAINDSGQITGWSQIANDHTVMGIHAFLWDQATGMQDLGFTVPCCYAQAGINNSGQIAGTYVVSSTGPIHAFSWSRSTGLQDLGAAGGSDYSSAYDINDSGQIVGSTSSSCNGTSAGPFPFLWTASGGMQLFADCNFGAAFGLNERGDVVGTIPTDDFANADAFVWTADGGMQDLGSLGECCSEYNLRINDKDQVVGTRWTGPTAFVWSQSTGIQDLNTLVATNIVLNFAGSINSLGQIIAWNYHSAFLLTPKMSTVVTSSLNPSQAGQPVTLAATVGSIGGPPPDGELVTFYDGLTEIGVGTTASGVATFTTSSLAVRTHAIKATYAGDGVFKPSSGKMKQVVQKP